MALTIATTTPVDTRQRPGAERFWPLILGPLAIGWCLLAVEMGWPALHAKSVQEVVALTLTSLALAAGLVRSMRTGQPVAILLTAVAATTLLREIHWDWTSRGVYVLLALIACWGLLWRKRVMPYLDANAREGAWLICTAATYFLSQFVARRGFQHILPESSSLHALFQMSYDDMEEVVENIAHLMLLITILHGRSGRLLWPKQDAQPAAAGGGVPVER